MKIIVSHNAKRLNVLLSGLADTKTVQAAIARSIKRTLPAIQKKGFQELRSKQVLKLKASQVKQRMRAYSVTGSGKPASEQYGKVWITPKPEGLAHFYAKRVRAGVSIFNRPLYAVRLNSYGQPYLKNPGRSFLAGNKGGGVVFARMAGAKRLPIEKQFGPGLAQLVQETGILNSMEQVALVRYAEEFDHNVEFYVQRALDRALAVKN